MPITISIVVPVYNSATFVHRALDSVFLHQKEVIDQIEVVCVNDGSTDNSLTVLEQYLTDHPNMKVVSQLNKGLGGARNTGVAHALGSYVLFLDSDDYLPKNSLSFLLSSLANDNLDILEFGARGVEDSTFEKSYEVVASTSGNVYSGSDYLHNFSYMVSACNKLYKRSFLLENSLSFVEKIFAEDVEFNSRAMLLAKKVKAIPEVCAHFVQTKGSITRNTDVSKNKKMIDDLLFVATSIDRLITTSNSRQVNIVLSNRISDLVASMFYRIFQIDRKDNRMYDQYISLLKEKKIDFKYNSQLQIKKRLFLQLVKNPTLWFMASSISPKKKQTRVA